MTCGAWLMFSMPPASDDAGFVQLDVLRAAEHRLDARAAQAIDGQRRHLDRQARLEADVARAVVRVDAGLLHVAEHDVIDPSGLTPVRSSAPREAMAPSSIAEKSLSAPTYCVIGVRAPPRMKTCL